MLFQKVSGDTAVGRVAVVTDPFGNRLTLVDLSRGAYAGPSEA